MKLLTIHIRADIDTDPDLSDIGEYLDGRRKPVKATDIDRAHGCYVDEVPEDAEPRYWDTRECRYFRPYAAGETPGTVDYRKYGMQDYEQMEAYNRSDWCMLFVRAVASIQIGETVQTIESGGCGGISSDGDYWKEIGGEEVAALRGILLDIGISAAEFDDCEVQEWSAV